MLSPTPVPFGSQRDVVAFAANHLRTGRPVNRVSVACLVVIIVVFAVSLTPSAAAFYAVALAIIYTIIHTTIALFRHQAAATRPQGRHQLSPGIK